MSKLKHVKNLFHKDQTHRVGLQHRVEPRREDLGDDSEH